MRRLQLIHRALLRLLLRGGASAQLTLGARAAHTALLPVRLTPWSMPLLPQGTVVQSSPTWQPAPPTHLKPTNTKQRGSGSPLVLLSLVSPLPVCAVWWIFWLEVGCLLWLAMEEFVGCIFHAAAYDAAACTAPGLACGLTRVFPFAPDLFFLR